MDTVECTPVRGFVVGNTTYHPGCRLNLGRGLFEQWNRQGLVKLLGEEAVEEKEAITDRERPKLKHKRKRGRPRKRQVTKTNDTASRT